MSFNANNTYYNDAVRQALIPLIKVMLKNHISHDEFSELAKHVFISVVQECHTLPNRKNSYARIAILTGLHLKEVKQMLQAPCCTNNGRPNRAVRVVQGWSTDPEFLDIRDQPKPLEIDRGDCSFRRLVKRYSGDISAKAMIDELLNLKWVSLSSGFLTLHLPSHTHANPNIEMLMKISEQLLLLMRGSYSTQEIFPQLAFNTHHDETNGL